jgi:glycosyltransferase involved in cell wall biosynthesis
VNQTYPRSRREFIFVDGLSDDGTKQLMVSFKNDHPNESVKILENPKRILSCGWNIALSEALGDALIRLDAHTRIPREYLIKCSEWLLKGEMIVGGQVISLEPQEGRWPMLLYFAESSYFGAGVASFRNPGAPRYVDTLAFAAYSRGVFDVVGGFNENVGRCEDNEMHYRIRKSDFGFFFHPEIKAYRFPRDTLRSLLGQMFGNGYWVGVTLGVAPRAIGLRHIIPGIFVLILASIGVLGLLGVPMVFYMFLGSYLLLGLGFSWPAFLKLERWEKAFCVFIPILFLLIHFSYGIGTLIGIARFPFLLKLKGKA